MPDLPITFTAVSESSALDVVDVDRAVELILDKLAKNPAAAAMLLPGYTIKRLPMTPAMRSELFLPRAAEKRRSNNEERLRKVWLVIDDQMAKDPSISDLNLAAALNCADLGTYTGKRFNAGSVHRLLDTRCAR